MPSFNRDPEELSWRTQRRWRSPQRWRCVYCGTKSPRMQVDHFSPFIVESDSSARNLVPACPTCNSEKQDRDPAEWMSLVGVPPAHAAMLVEVSLDRDWRAPLDLVIPQTALDYAAGKQAPRLPRSPRLQDPADPEPLDSLDFLDSPNCPNDLVPMNLVGGDFPRWQCPECGLTKI